MGTVSYVASFCARNPQFSFPGNMLSLVSLVGEARSKCLVWGVRKAVGYLTTVTLPPCRCSLPEVPVLPIPEFWGFGTVSEVDCLLFPPLI